MAFFNFYVLWRDRSLFVDLRDQKPTSVGDMTSLNDLVAVSDQVGLVVSIAVAVTFLVWFHRVYANLGELVRPDGSRGARHATGWAVGAWFVPPLNLWQPATMMDELWARKQPISAHGSAWVVWVWWAAYLGSALVAILQFFIDSGDIDERITSTTYGFVGQLLGLIGAALAIVMVRGVTAAQHASRSG